jgi:hypothetical protein
MYSQHVWNGEKANGYKKYGNNPTQILLIPVKFLCTVNMCGTRRKLTVIGHVIR